MSLMSISVTATSLESSRNNFGLLRLVLAFLVIVAHSPELIDGDRPRELLTEIFGTLSFGEFGVSGFFIVSGYLISKSFVRTRSTLDYTVKRAARILPGYLLAFFLSLILAVFVTPLDAWTSETAKDLGKRLITLRDPVVDGVFAGLPYPHLNGPLWTIAYEVRCYIAVAVAGLAGLLSVRWRWAFAAFTLVLLVGVATDVLEGVQSPLLSVTGSPVKMLELAAAFAVGASIYLFEDRLPWAGWTAALAGVCLAIGLVSERFSLPALYVFGGYLLIWFALRAPALKVGGFTDRLDLSYGLYLYAWPIQNLIVWNYRNVDPWVLTTTTTILALPVAWISFKAVEKPALRAAQAWVSSHDRTPLS